MLNVSYANLLNQTSAHQLDFFGARQHCFTFTQHFKLKCDFGTQIFCIVLMVQGIWAVQWGSSMLSEFCTSLLKVLTRWHCFKVKQHYPRYNFFVFCFKFLGINLQTKIYLHRYVLKSWKIQQKIMNLFITYFYFTIIKDFQRIRCLQANTNMIFQKSKLLQS